jgi:hypothetical protein
MKLFIALFVMICALGFGQADAMQATPSGSASGSLGYTCSNNSGGTPTCECAGVDDCLDMDDAGVCNGELDDGSLVNDTSCTPGFGSCSCTWRPSQSIEPGHRPESHSSGINMAPADDTLTIRDRRNTHRTGSLSQPQTNRSPRDHRSGSSTDDSEAEEASEVVPATRTRRDHRNSGGD